MQEWSFNFGPGFVSPEEIREAFEQRQAELKNKIDEKKCVMCMNASLINDQIAICNKKGSAHAGECVDEFDGKSCGEWSPIFIN